VLANPFKLSTDLQVRVLIVEKRVNEILNRLNKTRVERRTDLKGTHKLENDEARTHTMAVMCTDAS
jgi:hypothetical protein